MSAAAQAAVPCPGPGPQPEPLAPGVWHIPGGAGDSTAANRGAISNGLAVRDGGRLWLVGAGPSPRLGRVLACRLHALTGLRVTDIVVPWPRAELTLGQSAFGGARRWALDEVADEMHERCPRCVARMRQRLGERAGDLGAGDPIRLPTQRLQGAQGQVGPFLWWRARRADDTAVLVLRLRTPAMERPLWTAHGLLWGDGPPDLRDADPQAIAASLGQLSSWALRDGEAMRWLPEQGPLLDADAPAQQAHYLAALQQAVDAAQQRGDLETDLPATLDGVAPALLQSERHALNWQRVWHLREAASFETR